MHTHSSDKPPVLAESAVLWATHYLPLLYDLAWTFERHEWMKPFQQLTELCHEIDEILAKQQYVRTADLPARKKEIRP